MLALKSDVNRALEAARAEKRVKKSTDAKLTLYFTDEGWAAWQLVEGHHIPQLCIVSRVEAVHGAGEGTPGEAFPGLTVQVEPDEAPKCPRCWNHHPDIGAHPQFPELCPRCAAVLDGTRANH